MGVGESISFLVYVCGNDDCSSNDSSNNNEYYNGKNI